MSCAGLVGVQYSDGGACYKVIAIEEEEDGEEEDENLV